MSRTREVSFIGIVFVAIFLFLSVVTYHHSDSSWTHVGSGVTHNAAGKVGAWIADILLVISGYVAFLIPLLIGLFAWRWLYRYRQITNPEIDESAESYEPVANNNFWLRFVGFIVFLLSAAGLVALYIPASFAQLPAGTGGITGSLISHWAVLVLNQTGTTLVLFTLLLASLTLSLGISWLTVFDAVGKVVTKLIMRITRASKRFVKSMFTKRAQAAAASSSTVSPKLAPNTNHTNQQQAEFDLNNLNQLGLAEAGVANNLPNIGFKPKAKPESKLESKSVSNTELNSNSNTKSKSKSKPKNKTKTATNVGASAIVGFDLLNPIPARNLHNISSNELSMLSQEVEQRLLDFGIKVEVVGVHPGPVITRFELALSPGMKAGKITSLSTDLARSLSAVSVRVVEVIPGKAVVGLEIPNQTREIVSLREVLESKQYHDAKSPVSLALGKDIAGHPVVVDLAKMPHLLVAGTTGSGKSVGLNAMLLSLLYKSTPEEVRMILVDPKMLELSIYDGVPHLLTPVVTDMKEAANALRWCVAEMEKRYKLMAFLGVRNLNGYNEKVKQAQQEKKPLDAPEWYASQCEDGKLTTLPMIVVVIDEFADMMMVVGKKVEQLIARIAQKARAAGIHLILATQRPSVNVITGLIKANIPTRIAFQVSSKIDSRTILDQQGAQQLLGHGDMLYLAPGSGVPVRVHGAFVADEEVHQVVAAWQEYGTPDYLELGYGGFANGEPDGMNGLEGLEGFGDDDSDGEKDALYDQAVQIVIDTRKASISSIQRRLKIGYNRAARLVETMEEAGLVGPMENNGSREILIPNKEG